MYDPTGADDAEGGGEYVALRNTTDRTLDVSGFTVRDYANNLLRTGADAVIEPGSRYFVYSAVGVDRPDAHFNGVGAVFNNTGTDHAYLYDERQRIIDISSYIA